MRPIAGTFHPNSRVFPSLSRRAFACSLVGLIATMRLDAQQHRRIVSTAPSITEALFALGLGDQVVGVSRYCNYPAQVEKLPKVGTYMKPDVEAIARLAPDLIVLQTASAVLTDRLKAMRMTYVEVPHGTLGDVYTGIRLIANAAAVADRAVALIGKIQGELAKIQAKARVLSSPRVAVVVDRRQGTLGDLTAIGPDNYLNEILGIAGGTNVFAKAGLPRYPHLSLEAIVRENPDVIFDLSSTQDSEAMREQARPAVLALWAQHAGLKAAASGHVYFGTSNALLVPGPRAPEAAQLLFDFMHGVDGRNKR